MILNTKVNMFKTAKPKTLDQIVSTFTQTISDLNSLIEKNSKAIVDKDVAKSVLESEIKSLGLENDQADRIKSKIEQLVA